MKIKKVTAAHLDEICKIEHACFTHPWSRASIEEELNNPAARFTAAEEDGKIIGYLGAMTVLDECYIFNIAVLPSYQGRGAGTALMNGLITQAKAENFSFITLEVRQSNENAIRFYSHFGFIKAGERKNYYSHPTEDAALMTKYF